MLLVVEIVIFAWVPFGSWKRACCALNFFLINLIAWNSILAHCAQWKFDFVIDLEKSGEIRGGANCPQFNVVLKPSFSI